MEETVTTDKPKNPGRQEWGRKLGKMSKELKLKKQVTDMCKSIETTREEPPKSSFHIEYVFGIAGVFIGLAALYYQKKSYESVVVEQPNAVKPKREVKLSDF
jgi:hypothetical protein